MKIQTKISFRNADILEILQKHGISIKQFAERSGINYASVINVISFNTLLKKESQVKFMQALQELEPSVMYEDIFGESAEKARKIFGRTNVSVNEIPDESFIRIGNLEFIDSISEDEVINKINNQDLKLIIDNNLKTLSKREEEVIKLLFGIDCSPWTLGEIGEKFELTKERVRQIKEKAIRRLKHSGRCVKLRNFIYDGIEPELTEYEEKLKKQEFREWIINWKENPNAQPKLIESPDIGSK